MLRTRGLSRIEMPLSPRRLVLLLSGLVLLALWGVTAVAVIGDRDRIYGTASAELLGATPALKMHARRSFDTAHAILIALDEALQAGGEDFDLGRLSTLALKIQNDDDDPISIGIIDAGQHLIRIDRVSAGVEAGDRDYATAMRNGVPGERFIGAPVMGRVSGRGAIPLAMKAHPNAAGIDALLAEIPTAGFEEAYRNLLISAPSVIALLRQDGLVLHMTPDPDGRAGKMLPGFDLDSLGRQSPPMTVFEQGRLEEPGTHRKVSYAAVEGFPLTVFAAMRESYLLEAWQRIAWPKLAAAAAGSIVLVLLSFFILTLMVRRDAAITRLAQMLGELEAANRAKRDFMARMSHELRTPLNAIIGFSEMISGAVVGPLPKTYQEYGRDIHRSGEHLLAMINQVLDITRIESGALTLQEMPVDIGVVAAEAQDILRNLAELRKVTMRCAVEPQARLLLADPMMTRQMMLNLLSNALKASPPGAVVVLRAVVVDGGVQMQVIDQGAGIPPEKLAQIFEPFGNGESMLADQSAGIGLGLPITRKLIEMHGGELTLVSGAQGGTTATLHFPATRRVDG